MNIERTQLGSVDIWHARGRLDVSSAPELEAIAKQAVEKQRGRVVMDMHLLDYISSAGLRSLLLVSRQIQAMGGKIVVATPTQPVQDVLDMAGFASIIPIYREFHHALAALQTSADDSSVPTMPPLSLAEELYLLALDEKRGTRRSMVAFTFDYVVAGALLMELALLNRVDADLKTVNVVDATPTGNPLLDTALREVAAAKQAEPPTYWLKSLAYQAEQMEESVVQSLIEKGLLQREERKLLWVFSKPHYTLLDRSEVKDVRTRLRELILSNEIPTPRDVVLVSIAHACGVLTELFTDTERQQAQQRIDILARLDLIGQEMDACIREIQSALAETSVLGM